MNRMRTYNAAQSGNSEPVPYCYRDCRQRRQNCADQRENPGWANTIKLHAAYRTTGLALLLLLMAMTGAFAQAIQLPPVVRTRLSNGVRLVLMEYHRAPTLTVRAFITGGGQLDPEDKVGAMNLTADLMKRGTETRSAVEIAEAIDFLGGSLEIGASDDRVTASLDVLVKDADAGLDLLADVLRRPTFPADELDRQRKLSIAGLESMSDDARQLAGYVLNPTMFGAHPYGREATVSSLTGITREDVLAAYRRGVAPERMVIVAVGDFRTSEMQARLQARFGDWSAGTDTVPETPTVSPAKVRRVLIDKPDATQTQVRLARTAFPRSSKDFTASLLANAILGGGFTSRLIDQIRVAQSLTYGIGSGFSARKAGGLFTISTFTKIETSRKIVDATRKVLADVVAGGVTEAEYRKARGFLAGQFAIEVQTPEALAGQLSTIAFYGLPDDYLQTYLKRLLAVSKSDVDRVARTYFAPDAMSIILVGPAAKIRQQLNGLGEFEVRPANTVGR